MTAAGGHHSLTAAGGRGSKNRSGSEVRIGVELVELDGLDGDGGGGAEDGFEAGGAGDLGGGTGEAEDDLAVGLGAGEVLEQLEGNVGGIQVGEDQDIGGQAGLGAGELDFSGGGVDGHIGLQLAFDVDFEELSAGLLAGQGGRRGHALGIRGVGGAFGGVAEHGHARGTAEEVAGEFAGFQGDGGEILHRGIGDEPAVGKEQQAVIAVVLEMRPEDQAGGKDFGDVGEGFDSLDQGAEKGGGQRLVAADDGVGLTVLDHQRTEIMGAGDNFRWIGNLQRAVTGHVLHAPTEQPKIGGGGRIDDMDEGERHAMGGGQGADAFAVAQENGGDGFVFDEVGGDLEDAQILAFGEDDALGMAAQLVEKDLGDHVLGGEFWGEIGHWGYWRLRRGWSLV